MNGFTSAFAPQQSAMQPQSPVIAPAQVGYQQQLAQALRSQPMASSETPDPFSGMTDMLKKLEMQKMMASANQTPTAAPMMDAGITNQPMLSQFGSMVG